MKLLKSLEKAEAYLEPKRVSAMELFLIDLKAYYFRNKSSIMDIWLGSIQALESEAFRFVAFLVQCWFLLDQLYSTRNSFKKSPHWRLQINASRSIY